MAPDRNSSHFTCLRIIRALSLRRGEWNKEGQGFVDITQLISMFEDVFDNREDVLRSLNRMVAKQLVEANTKSTESIYGASHIRVTSAGWYFSRFLVRAFSYLDLVLQDTPINDPNVADFLLREILEFEKIPDREELKLERMAQRFSRVRSFLDYLANEEAEEQRQFELSRLGGIWAEPFVPGIRAQIENEVGWIERRLAENRERYAEDIRVGTDEITGDAPDEDNSSQTTTETEVGQDPAAAS